MNKTRFAVKAFAGTLVATVMVLGSLSAPAQAKPDTGWGPVAPGGGSYTMMKGDTGWGP